MALVGVDGAIAASDAEPVSLHLTADGGAEQDPAEWWDALAVAVRRMLASAGGARVAGICPTGQWSGTVALGGDGQPLHRAIIWMDSRGAPDVRRLVRGPLRVAGYDPRKLRTWVSRTGGAPGKSGKDPLAHILWLRRARPDVYRAAAVFLEPKDWLVHRLTGVRVATTDSIALHWVTDNRDLANVCYDDELLALAGIDPAKLPDLVAPTAVAGALTAWAASDLGLPAGIPVLAGSPDLHTAAVGSGAVDDFAAHLYVGTSDWIGCHVPFKKTDVVRNVATVPAAIPGRYLVVNEQESAGACLDYLADNLLIDAPADRATTYRRFDELAAAAPPGSGGALFLPWLNGERTPVEDAALRAGFFNLSVGTDRRHLVRAVFEGVAYNVRWLLAAVERLTGRRHDPITMVGGAARSGVWGQIFADVLDRNVRCAARPIDVNLRGAGLLGAHALGHLRLDDLAAAVPIDRVHEPDPATGTLHDGRFREFLAFHRANRRALRRLNR